jgi:lariat debranching enzyme
LNALQPRYWFSAHMHCKFPAIIKHEDTGQLTKFLALDKVGKGTGWMQVIDVEDTGLPKYLSYDPEWLAILLLTQDLYSNQRERSYLPFGSKGR